MFLRRKASHQPSGDRNAEIESLSFQAAKSLAAENLVALGSKDFRTNPADPESYTRSWKHSKGWSGVVALVLGVFGFVASASAAEPVKPVADRSSVAAKREGAVRRRRHTQSKARGRTAKRPGKRTKSSWLPKMPSNGATTAPSSVQGKASKRGIASSGQEKVEAPKAAEQDKPDKNKKIPVIAYAPRESAGVPPKSRMADAVGRSLKATRGGSAKGIPTPPRIVGVKSRTAGSDGARVVGTDGTRRASTVSPLDQLKRDSSWWGGKGASVAKEGTPSVRPAVAREASAKPRGEKSSWWRPSILAKRIKQAGKKIWYVEKKK